MRYLYLAAMLCAFQVVQAQDAASKLLFGFTEPSAPARWITVNDNVMGGRSTGGPTFTDSTLVFAGTTNTNGGGFSSIRTRPQLEDLSEYAGIELRYRGDGRTYEVELRNSAQTRGIQTAYRAVFETEETYAWQTVRLPFSEFLPTRFGEVVEGNPVDPSQVQSVGLFIYDGVDGPFEIEVDAIRAYTDATEG